MSKFSPAGKPAQLRAIFILNALMMVLPFVFYAVFTLGDISIGGLEPITMVYTALGYIASFALLVFLIIRKQLWPMRALFVVNILIALPASAYIGILVAIASMFLSFTPKVKGWFAAPAVAA